MSMKTNNTTEQILPTQTNRKDWLSAVAKIGNVEITDACCGECEGV